MQLRIARLCLDCEELHVDNRCPRCASERYAFLTNWLPSEERRRWRRATPGSDAARDRDESGFVASVARWLRGARAPQAETGPLTRASDNALLLNFDEEPEKPPKKTRELDVQFSEHDTR